jgi:hypothetical protein
MNEKSSPPIDGATLRITMSEPQISAATSAANSVSPDEVWSEESCAVLRFGAGAIQPSDTSGDLADSAFDQIAHFRAEAARRAANV